MANPAVQTVPAANVLVLDNFNVGTTHTMVVTAAAGTTGGVCSIQVSQDGVNWFSTAAAALTAAGVTSTTVTGAFRFVRANITTVNSH
jgi:hypothetical protein